MTHTELLARLADGEFHSGQLLANDMGVSRTAVWKQLARLEGLGLELESVRGLGYRIPGGLDLLREVDIRAGLSPEAAALTAELAVLQAVDSTNAELLRRDQMPVGQAFVCTAEQQQAGRGRRGRDWVSPFARNVYLSMSWNFVQGVAALEGLSLAAGVCVTRALASVGLPAPQLKWPNDIVHEGRKLGGILIEMTGDAAGPARAVVGIGINVRMPTMAAAAIEQPWTDLAALAGGNPPGRGDLIAVLLNELLPMLAGFEGGGFAPWREEWMALDAYAGQPVIVTTGSQRISGLASGVNHRGALLLETAGGTVPVFGGEVSMRPLA